jgi:hypothetical protein
VPHNTLHKNATRRHPAPHPQGVIPNPAPFSRVRDLACTTRPRPARQIVAYKPPQSAEPIPNTSRTVIRRTNTSRRHPAERIPNTPEGVIPNPAPFSRVRDLACTTRPRPARQIVAYKPPQSAEPIPNTSRTVIRRTNTSRRHPAERIPNTPEGVIPNPAPFSRVRDLACTTRPWPARQIVAYKPPQSAEPIPNTSRTVIRRTNTSRRHPAERIPNTPEGVIPNPAPFSRVRDLACTTRPRPARQTRRIQQSRDPEPYRFRSPMPYNLA